MLPFRDLRKDNPVYLFDRNGEMNIIMGRVVSDATAPHIDYNSTTMNIGRPSQMIVELNVEFDGKTQQYVIPEDSSVTVTPNNCVLATEISPIMREVETLGKRSQEIIDSVEINKKRKQRCDQLLEAWNPELRAKRESDRRITDIENSVKDLRTDLGGKFDLIMQKLGIIPTPNQQSGN